MKGSYRHGSRCTGERSHCSLLTCRSGADGDLGLHGRSQTHRLAERERDAHVGYGDTGYIARPKSASRTARAKSKALKAYGASYGQKPKKQASKGKLKKYAALDTGAMVDALPPTKSLTGGGVRWAASASCLNGTLRSVVAQVASYARVTVNSTCRSKSHNRKVGGASKSHHLTGDAVDFRVHGNVGAVYAFLRSNGSLGGVKHYGGGLFHVDTGPKRSW